MATIYKPTGRSKYIIEYVDENGARRRKTGTTDKAVTERLAREIENRVLLRREGLVDSKAETYRDHAARSLVEHIADWQADRQNSRAASWTPTAARSPFKRPRGR
jgi:hypothetical protein